MCSFGSTSSSLFNRPNFNENYIDLNNDQTPFFSPQLLHLPGQQQQQQHQSQLQSQQDDQSSQQHQMVVALDEKQQQPLMPLFSPGTPVIGDIIPRTESNAFIPSASPPSSPFFNSASSSGSIKLEDGGWKIIPGLFTRQTSDGFTKALRTPPMSRSGTSRKRTNPFNTEPGTSIITTTTRDNSNENDNMAGITSTTNSNTSSGGGTGFPRVFTFEFDAARKFPRSISEEIRVDRSNPLNVMHDDAADFGDIGNYNSNYNIADEYRPAKRIRSDRDPLHSAAVGLQEDLNNNFMSQINFWADMSSFPTTTATSSSSSATSPKKSDGAKVKQEVFDAEDNAPSPHLSPFETDTESDDGNSNDDDDDFVINERTRIGKKNTTSQKDLACSWAAPSVTATANSNANDNVSDTDTDDYYYDDDSNNIATNNDDDDDDYDDDVEPAAATTTTKKKKSKAKKAPKKTKKTQSGARLSRSRSTSAAKKASKKKKNNSSESKATATTIPTTTTLLQATTSSTAASARGRHSDTFDALILAEAEFPRAGQKNRGYFVFYVDDQEGNSMEFRINKKTLACTIEGIAFSHRLNPVEDPPRREVALLFEESERKMLELKLATLGFQFHSGQIHKSYSGSQKRDLVFHPRKAGYPRH